MIEKIELHPYDLREMGINDVAYIKEEALILINNLRNLVLPVLGGDVYILENKHDISYTDEGWSCERNENEDLLTYVNRSCQMAKEFINNYKAEKNIPLFCIVYYDNIKELIK